MIGFVKDNFIYIKCPKNGCITYSTILKSRGWREINLFENSLNYSQYMLWGHLTDPNTRHTKGVAQYLILNPELDINNPQIAKMIVSGVFDEHTYSLSMMLGPLFNLPVHWIPLDVEIKNFNHPDSGDKLVICNGDDLTNDFFSQYGIDIRVTAQDRKNQSNIHRQLVQKQVASLKELYDSNYQKLVKNFLEHDILLYHNTVKNYRIQYGGIE
jgi:hypothetical protein